MLKIVFFVSLGVLKYVVCMVFRHTYIVFGSCVVVVRLPRPGRKWGDSNLKIFTVL